MTIKALAGNTLLGHNFTFYQLSSYTNVTPTTGTITGFDLADVADNKPALGAALTVHGYAVADTAAHTLATLTEPELHTIAAYLKDHLPATSAATKTPAAHSDPSEAKSFTVTLPAGYYLMTDSKGNPVIFATRTDDGRDVQGDNSQVTIKSTDVEKPPINTDPDTDPDPNVPPAEPPVPGKGDNNNHHIVKIASDVSVSHLHGFVSTPGSETGHNTPWL